MKPILKWVGGKSQLLEELKHNIPESFNNYFEPFFGGGALAFEIANKPKVMFLSDLNKELVDFYAVVRNRPSALIKQIDEFKKSYNESPEFFYYELRNADRDFDYKKNTTKVWRAARTLFINKTCFNGMHRVNSKGEFNVPWNQELNAPNVVDNDNLRQVSKFLKSSKVECSDFESILNKIKPRDFVYIDPPYDKIKKDTFVEYNKESFGTYHQKKLALVCEEIDRKGAFFMVSNHNTELIREIYKNYKIDVIYARRSINSKGAERGKVEEVLIKNY
ncbi:modification methylase [Mesoplasma syrphidae]|uniref:Site-specific DNA-methyltransferase (adenine-specific) n=1 Tax=Mesoplasma syrphidae TaxID=225999 RepID=A0A2K9BZL0_9MOLU|nr:Dam family site-specific DNA-(adenine-N6)-methyltransferase [Mesoplasma syrphidae]AUF83798.1 modification methylase [Mesoplasma syrphidae]